jgi:triosephosphate isomerase
MKRRKILAGNWKCHKSFEEAVALITEIVANVPIELDRTVVLCPPFPYLAEAVRRTEGSPVKIGAQNVWQEDSGAFTGEVSAPMLASLGVEYTIVGHSERRQVFAESDECLARKVNRALAWNLIPIFCLGERWEERETGQTLAVVQRQFQAIFDLPAESASSLVIAYEPIWAIGTGRNATPQQAEEVHAILRGLAMERWGSVVAEGVRILYGGSVKGSNIDALMAMPNLDGALVGGASLAATEFLRIVHFEG